MNKVLILAVLVSCLFSIGCASQTEQVRVALPVATDGPCTGKGGGEYLACLRERAEKAELLEKMQPPPPEVFPSMAPQQPMYGMPGPFARSAGPTFLPSIPGPQPVLLDGTPAVVNCNDPDVVFTVNNGSHKYVEVRGLSLDVASCDARQLDWGKVRRRDGSVALRLLVPPHPGVYRVAKFAFVMPARTPVDRASMELEAYRDNGSLIEALAIGHLPWNPSIPPNPNSLNGNEVPIGDNSFIRYGN